MNNGTAPNLVLFDQAMVREVVRRSRIEQGLPERVTDMSLLQKLAVLVKGR